MVDNKWGIHAGQPKRIRRWLPTSRWITRLSRVPARVRRVVTRVTLVNQRNFATVPGQFYDLIQWMREGCGRERDERGQSGENAKPSFARPYIGCTPRDEFPTRIASNSNRESEKALWPTASSRCDGKRIRAYSRIFPSVALHSAAMVHIRGVRGCIAIRCNKISIRIYIGNLINSRRTTALL